MTDRSDQFAQMTVQMHWFTGVVEDVLDPQQAGRVRVRCHGYHSADRGEIPTESLPWALVMMPITSASMSGIGASATGVLQGSWVVGFFRDGPSAQQPLVLGTIPGGRSSRDATGLGFTDPSGVYPIPSWGSRPDTPAQSTGDFRLAGSYVERRGSRQQKIEEAVPARVDTISVPQGDSYYQRPTWDQPDPQDLVRTAYPKCHSQRSESGHVEEVDDTPGAKRTLRQHASGTYEEVYDAGDRTLVVKGSDYEVVFSNKRIYVKGDVSMTVDGDLRQLVKGNYHLEVRGDRTELIAGSSLVKIGGNLEREVGFVSAENVGKEKMTTVAGNETRMIGGDAVSTIAGSLSTSVAGGFNVVAAGDLGIGSGGDASIGSGGSMAISSAGDLSLETTSDALLEADGNTTIKGSIIDLNP